MTPGIYQHFKGTVYFVVGTAVHSETREQMVVYFSLEHRTLWVRPLSMFEETVEYEGQKVPRFKIINDGRSEFSWRECCNG